MLTFQNIILMPVKKRTLTRKRNPIGAVVLSLDLPTHDLHHAHPLIQAQGLGPGPIQEVLPVPDQDLVPVPENTLDLVGRNQDPAPGPTGGLPPQEKDLTQALVHHLPPREARNEVVLDLLHLAIAKKDDRDHGHPKDAADHHLDLPILVPVQVLKRNNVLKLTFKKKKKLHSVHETFLRSWCLTWSEVLNLLVEVHVCPCFLENCSFVHS